MSGKHRSRNSILRPVGRSIGHTRLRRFASVVLALALLGGFAAYRALPAQAAITTPFAKMYSVNTSGNIQIRGNTVMTCQSAATRCAAARTASNTGADNNNNNFFMTYVDVDGSPTTFDSSSSTVALPSGASVLYAALTWGGNTGAGTVINSTGYGTGTATAAPGSNGSQVSLNVPGGTGYQTVTSTRTTPASGTGAYQGYADVTSIVSAAGNGSYTVGNVQSGTGGNQYGGWALTIAYANPTDPPRNLTIFAGYGSVAGTAGNDIADLPVSGFQTPLTGLVKTTLGAVSYEGDAGSTGDQMQLGNTTGDLQNVTDALHSTANTFTSVISDVGVDNSVRDPRYKNQLGYDEATFGLNGALANNATSAVIRLTTAASGGETYYPGVVTFATDLYAPSLSATKSVALVNKAPGNVQSGVPEPGDTLRYTVNAVNNGADNAVKTVLTDAIPTGTTFVPGSLKAGATSLTDGTGDDIGSYASGAPTVRVNLGTGAGFGTTPADGGTVAVGAATATVTFDVTVNSDIADGAIISNTAQFTYTGQQNSLAVAGASNAVTAAAVRHHSALSITKTSDTPLVQKGASTHVTYTLTATNNGPYGDPGVTITDTLPAGATLVSATPSAGSCTTPGNTVVCAIGAVANGRTASVDVVVTLDSASDPATDTASVAGQNADDTAGDDTASRSTAVNTAPVAVDDSANTANGSATISILANDSDPDGDPLSATVGPRLPAKGSAVVNANGTLTYTADPAAIGSDTVDYTVSDGRGGSTTATVHITIPNTAPTAAADATSTTPGTPVVVSVLDNDTDPNSSQILVVASVTQPAGGAGTVTTNGTTVRFVPAASFRRGTTTFSYTVSDGAGGTDTATVTVTIPDQAPVAAADTATTDYRAPVTVDVLANDTDDNGDPLTVTLVTGDNHGTATIVGTGASTKIRYVPDAGWSGVDTMTYTISDGTTSVTGTLSITTGNGLPTAGDFAVTVDGATATTIDAAGHATDPNGDSLIVTGARGAAHGTVIVAADGTVVYTPDPTYAGPDSFTYTVDDDHGGTADGTVTVTVANQRPAAHDDVALVPGNRSVIISVLDNDTDPNADPLSVTSTAGAAHGTATAHPNGTITYTPDRGYLGDDSFTYRIGDGHGGTDTATVSVTVANGSPTAVADTAEASGQAGSAITIDVLANDTDPNDDDLSIVDVTTRPAHGTAVITAGHIVYTPQRGYAGPDTFRYRISDGRGGSSEAAVSVTVLDRDPVATPDAAVVAGAPTVLADVLANDSDPDGDPLTLVTVSTPAHGTAVVNGDGRIVFTPEAGYAGPDTFTYTIRDGRGGTATATVTVTVGDTAPVAVDDSVTTPFAHDVTVDVLANDTDANANDPLTITDVATPTHGTAVITDGHIVYTPARGFAGTDTVSYTISDGHEGTDTATLTVTVQVGPVAQPDDASTKQGVSTSVNPLVNDTPGADATFNPATFVLFDPLHPTVLVTHLETAGGTYDVTVGQAEPGFVTVAFAPNPGFTGVDTVGYRITDGFGNDAFATINITVTAVTPVALDDVVRSTPGATVTVNVLDNDRAGDPAVALDPSTVRLALTSAGPYSTEVTVADQGTFTVDQDGRVTFVPVDGFQGQSSIVYQVADANGTLATATLAVEEPGSTDASAIPDSVDSAGTAVTLDPLANDRPSLGAHWISSSLCLFAAGSDSCLRALTVARVGRWVVADDASVRFTPAKGYQGDALVSYGATDSAGQTSRSMLRVHVIAGPAPGTTSPMPTASPTATEPPVTTPPVSTPPSTMSPGPIAPSTMSVGPTSPVTMSVGDPGVNGTGVAVIATTAPAGVAVAPFPTSEPTLSTVVAVAAAPVNNTAATGLASTGSPDQRLLIYGLGALLLGAALCLVGRRRTAARGRHR